MGSVNLQGQSDDAQCLFPSPDVVNLDEDTELLHLELNCTQNLGPAHEENLELNCTQSVRPANDDAAEIDRTFAKGQKPDQSRQASQQLESLGKDGDVTCSWTVSENTCQLEQSGHGEFHSQHSEVVSKDGDLSCSGTNSEGASK